MLYEAVDNGYIIIKSVFEVYSFTLDRQDLVENLILAYNQIYKLNVKKLMKSLTLQLKISKSEVTPLPPIP